MTGGEGRRPRFDEPTFTVPVEQLFTRLPVAGPAPLPPLVEPDEPPVTAPVDEPQVPLQHRSIRVLANYWHGGWEHAVPHVVLRKTVAETLYRVADSLPERWGLAVFDAWRPLDLQKELYDAAFADPETEPGFMAPVSHDPRTPPPHLTGGAVDLTLTYDGTPLAAGSGFDDTTKLAHTAILEDRPGPARDLRRLLYQVMSGQGFVVFAFEWWHFELGTRRWAAITGGQPRYGPADLDRAVVK